MTDKQIIETLENVREFCIKSSCLDCRFNLAVDRGGVDCQFKMLASSMNISPNMWDIDKITKVINK